jgi:hypothetical protein
VREIRAGPAIRSGDQVDLLLELLEREEGHYRRRAGRAEVVLRKVLGRVRWIAGGVALRTAGAVDRVMNGNRIERDRAGGSEGLAGGGPRNQEREAD